MQTRMLVVFDVDGTLIDSAALICDSMAQAFEAVGLVAPSHAETRSIIGLSLPVAISRLAPALDAAGVEKVVASYKAAFIRLRAAGGEIDASPLFDGARAALSRLHVGGATLGVATGKARRGLDHVLHGHDLAGLFHAVQTADDAPSKPHPEMLLNILRDTGADASRSAMIGDTTFDMQMAAAAGYHAIGVAWGCHSPDALRAAGAAAILEHFDELDAVLHAGRAA